MDCLAAGARHSLSLCQKGKQPLPEYSVKYTPAIKAGTQASLLHQHRRACNKSYGASSFTPPLDASSSSCPKRVNASKAPEDQVRSSSSLNITNRKQNGRASSANLTNRNPNNVDSMSKLTSSSSNEHVSSIAKPRSNNFKENGNAKLTNDRKDEKDGAHISRSCPDQKTSGAFKPRQINDENGGASSSTPDEAFLSSGPIVEMHSHVSGNNGSPVFNNPDPSPSHFLASKNIIEFIIRFPGWADALKESGMPQRQQRGFYSHEDWLRHRSSLRYVRHVLSSVSSRVIVSLVPPVFTFTAGAVGVAAYNTAVKFSLFPSYFPLLHAASLPYELTAPALALLLVFRTDASYSRYDEARKTWTSVISTTKDLARHCAQFIKSSQDVAIKSSLLSYIMAFPISLKCHLIHGSDTRKDLQDLLQDEDLAFVLASHHRPNCLIQLMSQSLGLVHLENTERVLLENHITQYTSSVSVCERLIRTPIPLSYTRLTSRFLVLWHMSLPIVLWDSCNWLVVPATFFSAATLFCIEEVGVLIEEPFPMLALDKIIGVAHDNIREMMKRQQETDYFLSGKRSHQTTNAE